MRLSVASVASIATFALPVVLAAQVQQGLTPAQQLAHDIYKELVEINTADSVGSTTVSANAVAKRFLDAGFPASDIFQGVPKPDTGTLVVRYPGSGALIVLAGTATSTRVRGGEPNAFNLPEPDGDRLTLRRQEWDTGSLTCSTAATETFHRWNCPGNSGTGPDISSSPATSASRR